MTIVSNASPLIALVRIGQSATSGKAGGLQKVEPLKAAGPFSFQKGVANQAENELKGFGPRGALLDRHTPYDPKPFHQGRLS
jgi:hypothetical protein